jgi:hypothetical protein
MVEILLAFPASDATMAAVNAATDKPFRFQFSGAI